MANATSTLLSDQKPRPPHLSAHVPDRLGVAEGTTGPMMTNEVGKLLTASEVAELLHLHVNTVKRLGDRGEPPFFRVTRRGDRRFRYDDVLEFLRRDK
jgi:excisionase family DNA binding protein